MSWPGTLLLILSGALFEMHGFTISGPTAEAFPAPLDSHGCADLAVLDEGALTVYPDAHPDNPYALRFPQNVSAVDLFDLDGDAVVEVVAVAGDQILMWSLDEARAGAEPVTLFQAKTQLAHAPGPYPYVLGVESEGKPLLGLPGETVFELRDVTGALVASASMDIAGPHRASYGRPFSVDPARGPLLGGPDAIELDVRRSIEIEPALPVPIANIDRGGLLRRRAALSSGNATKETNLAYWPWFALALAANERTSPFAQWDVLYSRSAENGESFVRMRSPTALAKNQPRVSPPRRFPGVLLNSDSVLPDFNGDGLADLLLWSDPAPGFSINRLVRLLTAGLRPLRFTVHFFDPKRARFQPTADASLLLDADAFPPYRSENDSTPVHLLVLGDFDGDGRTDIGCAVTETVFNVWRFTDTGFAAKPEFTHTFSEPLRGVEFCEPLAPGKGSSIGLRGENTLYLLRANGQAH